MEYLSWDTLPIHVLANVFSSLSYHDRFISSLVCKSWSTCFNYPPLWKHYIFQLNLKTDKDGLSLKCIDKYSNNLRALDVSINQKEAVSRERSCYILKKIEDLEAWKIVEFKIGFSNMNPPCFNGGPILNQLKSCLDLKDDKPIIFHLQSIDLSKLDIALDDKLIDILSRHHKMLRYCNIQNSCYVDNVSTKGLLNLIKSCDHIEELFTFYHCLSDDVLTALTERKTVPMKLLSIKCSICDKFNKFISEESWRALKRAYPDLQVSLEFDSLIQLDVVNKILVKEIPVFNINLTIYCWAHKQLQFIASEYFETLEELSVHNSIDPYEKANEEVIQAIMEVVRKCENLKQLHCYCMLPQAIIHEIKIAHPWEKYTLY